MFQEPHAAVSLDDARRQAQLSIDALWVRYFALGGAQTPFELDATLHGALRAGGHEHDVLAVAINERLHELGRPDLLRYRHDPDSRR